MSAFAVKYFAFATVNQTGIVAVRTLHAYTLAIIGILFSLYVILTFRVPQITITDAAMVSISTIASAAVGSLITYFLLNRNENRKETDFRQKVRDTVIYELKYVHDLLADGLKTGKPDPTYQGRLIIDVKSEIAERRNKLQTNTTLYSLLDTPTKLRAFTSDNLVRLEYMYSEIGLRLGFSMWFADAPAGPQIGVDIKAATELKTKIADTLSSLK